jgi:hypothetical protein
MSISKSDPNDISRDLSIPRIRETVKIDIRSQVEMRPLVSGAKCSAITPPYLSLSLLRQRSRAGQRQMEHSRKLR